MTSRRRFIQGLAALAPGLTLGEAFGASPDPSRLALVIGNSSYRDAPLVNPVNDARAVADLLGQAGFTVSSQLNVQRAAMMAAIEKFAVDVRKSETRLVMFYYAGHGAQLDWRNYLLPVDATADSAARLRQSCVDLNELIGQFGKSRDKTFVIMLDACRNNPFGSSYQPEQKGLSQFDAPVGSLLAYATSPGNVASDGAGQNGLYTGNLVRELAVRGTRIEDALKRVRLNVRMASGGAQIPWETTSLEDDVFIFSDGKKKLSEEEQEQLLEADLNEWARIKTSRHIDDWVSYLRNFPNGRFAEIAQTRLTRLLTPVAKPEPVGVAVTAPAAPPAPETVAATAPAQPALPGRQPSLDVTCTAPSGELKRNLVVRDNCAVIAPAPAQEHVAAIAPTPVAPPAPVPEPAPAPAPAPEPVVAEPVAQAAPMTPAIELAPSLPVPQLIQVSVNPYSAGRYPLGRKYSVGDSATYRASDLITDVEGKPFAMTVTSIDADNDRVKINEGQFLIDTMGNILRTPGGGDSDVPQQLLPAELQIGKAWMAGWKQSGRWGPESVKLDLRIAAFEKVRVPAGEFEAFRIEVFGWHKRRDHSLKREQRFWVVPGLNFTIKGEIMMTNQFRTMVRTDRLELVSLRQRTIDEKCAAQSGGLQGSLVVRNSCA